MASEHTIPTEREDLTPSEKACFLVAQYFNRKAEKTDQMLLTTNDVYIVWFCYILGGWKALVSTTIVDGMYYEVTYNKEKGETYLDAYKKWENICIKDGERLHDL